MHALGNVWDVLKQTGIQRGFVFFRCRFKLESRKIVKVLNMFFWRRKFKVLEDHLGHP